MKQRLVFLDILRIAAIGLVTYQHMITHYRYPIYYNLIINLDWTYLDWGKLAVAIFFFASGMSLAGSHLDISSWKEIKEFWGNRLLRIYPAYYVSILFSVIIQPSILQNTFTSFDYIKMTLGLQALGARTEADIFGKVNGGLWFLTPLIFLYLMFPLLVYVIRRHPHISIAAIFAINQASLYYFSISNVFFEANWWFPLCVIFEFSLGIYLIRMGWYPKTASKNKVIIYLSNITYFLFLVSVPLLVLGNYPLQFTVGLLVVGSMLYEFDRALREALRQITSRKGESTFEERAR